MEKRVYFCSNLQIKKILGLTTITELKKFIENNRSRRIIPEMRNFVKENNRLEYLSKKNFAFLKSFFFLFLNKNVDTIRNSIINEVGEREFEKKYKNIFRKIKDDEVEAFIRVILFLIGLSEKLTFINDPRSYGERFQTIYLLNTITTKYLKELVENVEEVLCFGKFGKRSNNGFDLLLIAKEKEGKYLIKTINLKFNGVNNVYVKRKSKIFRKIEKDIATLKKEGNVGKEVVKLLLRKKRSCLHDIGLDFLRKEKNEDLLEALKTTNLNKKAINEILNASIKQHQVLSLIENGWTYATVKNEQGFPVVTNEIVDYVELIGKNNLIVKIKACDLQPKLNSHYIELPEIKREKKEEEEEVWNKINTLLLEKIGKKKVEFNYQDKFSVIKTSNKIQNALYEIIIKGDMFKDFEVLSGKETKHRIEFIGCEEDLNYFYTYLEKWSSRYTIRKYDEIVLNVVPANERFSLITKISESKDIDTITRIKKFNTKIFTELIKKVEKTDFTDLKLEEIGRILMQNGNIALKITAFFQFEEGTINANWLGHKTREKRNIENNTFAILEDEKGRLVKKTENQKSSLVTLRFNFTHAIIKKIKTSEFDPVLLQEPMYFKIDKKGQLFIDFGNSKMIEKREAWIKYLSKKYDIREEELAILRKRTGLSTVVKQGLTMNGVNLLKGKEEDIALIILILWEYQKLWNKVGEEFEKIIKEKEWENMSKKYTIINQNKIVIEEKKKREYKIKLVGEKENKPNVQKKKVKLPEKDEIIKKYLKKMREIAEEDVFKGKKGKIIEIVRKLEM